MKKKCLKKNCFKIKYKLFWKKILTKRNFPEKNFFKKKKKICVQNVAYLDRAKQAGGGERQVVELSERAQRVDHRVRRVGVAVVAEVGGDGVEDARRQVAPTAKVLDHHGYERLVHVLHLVDAARISRSLRCGRLPVFIDENTVTNRVRWKVIIKIQKKTKNNK